MVAKGNFIKIEYTGYNENGEIFDSTSGEIARQLHGKEGPMLVVFGTDYLVPAMEEAIFALEKEKECEIIAPPEKAFGHRDAKKMRVLSINEFYKNNLNPKPGEVIEIKNDYGNINGLVKSVNSGRVLVDLNHPLANQTIKYKIKLVDIAEDAGAKIAILIGNLNIEGSFSLEAGKAVITMKKEQPDEASKRKKLEFAIKTLISEIKEVEFKTE